MTIKVGDRLPDAAFVTMGPEGPRSRTTSEVFDAKKIVLFAVPGAYTPTCHKHHIPGFVTYAPEFRRKGIDMIACTAVNDIFVLTQWAQDSGAAGKVTMLADGNAEFVKKTGLEIDLGALGLGIRSKRYAMVVDNGVVTALNVEETPAQHDKSSAQRLLSCEF